jgi:hypothetical protein
MILSPNEQWLLEQIKERIGDGSGKTPDFCKRIVLDATDYEKQKAPTPRTEEIAKAVNTLDLLYVLDVDGCSWTLTGDRWEFDLCVLPKFEWRLENVEGQNA